MALTRKLFRLLQKALIKTLTTQVYQSLFVFRYEYVKQKNLLGLAATVPIDPIRNEDITAVSASDGWRMFKQRNSPDESEQDLNRGKNLLFVAPCLLLLM